MKKFVLKVLLFFACVVVMDFAFGQFFSYLRTHAKGGSTANCEYIANRCQDDIIILGSSRTTHHYVPQIIEDSLGVTCYNCGEEGNGVVLAYGRLKMLTNRYKPKLVIYDITPEFDYGIKDQNKKYLGYLRPYYEKEGVDDIFRDFDDDYYWLKMKSKMYQNTSRLLPNLIDNILYRDNNKGFAPLSGKFIVPIINRDERSLFDIDSLKLSYMQKVIEICQNNDIPLILIMSPWFNYGNSLVAYEPAFRLCESYSIPVINCINEPTICHNPDLFQDISHLNSRGASVFTKSIIPVIKEMFY